ncbi:hypothetical protein ARSEF4850_002426 [Beauveria asiatica]
MKNTFLLVSTLAASTSAWTYPDCERDGCYRNLIDRRYADAAPAFCLEWISEASTAVSVIPSRFRNCPDVAAVSSACSCVAYTATHTTTTPRLTSTATFVCGTESSVLTSAPTTSARTTDSASGTTTSSAAISSTTSTLSTSSILKSSITEQTIWTVFTTATHTVTNCL